MCGPNVVAEPRTTKYDLAGHFHLTVCPFLSLSLSLSFTHPLRESAYCYRENDQAFLHCWSDTSFPGASRKDQPSFTMKQVSYLCERLLKDHEEKIREEYEQILNTKLAGNWHCGVGV